MNVDDQGRRAGSSAREAGNDFRAPEFSELRRRRIVARSVGITVAGFVAALAIGIGTVLLTQSTGGTPVAVGPDDALTATIQSAQSTAAIETTTPTLPSRDGVPVGTPVAVGPDDALTVTIQSAPSTTAVETTTTTLPSRDGVPVGLAATLPLEEITASETEMVEGVVRITDRCVTVEAGAGKYKYMAVWPHSFVAANFAAGELIFTDPTSGAATVIADGDRLVFEGAFFDAIPPDAPSPAPRRVSRIQRYVTPPDPSCDDASVVLVLGVSSAPEPVTLTLFTLTYQQRGFYTEGSATEFDMISVGPGFFRSGGKIGPAQGEELLQTELEPGWYAIRNWQRPCPGPRGFAFEAPTDMCAARFRVDTEPVTATVTVSLGKACSFAFSGAEAEPTGVGDYGALTLTFGPPDGVLDCNDNTRVVIDALPAVAAGDTPQEAIDVFLGGYAEASGGLVVHTGPETGSLVVDGREVINVTYVQQVGDGWTVHQAVFCPAFAR